MCARSQKVFFSHQKLLIIFFQKFWTKVPKLKVISSALCDFNAIDHADENYVKKAMYLCRTQPVH